MRPLQLAPIATGRDCCTPPRRGEGAWGGGVQRIYSRNVVSAVLWLAPGSRQRWSVGFSFCCVLTVAQHSRSVVLKLSFRLQPQLSAEWQDTPTHAPPEWYEFGPCIRIIIARCQNERLINQVSEISEMSDENVFAVCKHAHKCCVTFSVNIWVKTAMHQC